MLGKFKPVQLMYFLGVAALLIGFINPLRGFILVANGAVILAASAFLLKHRFRYYFLWGAVLIVLGVIAIYFFNTKGGFGGNSSLPYGLSWFMLPYPLGWIMMVITLIVASVRKLRQIRRIKADQQEV